MAYTKEDYKELLLELEEKRDDKLVDFHKNLIPREGEKELVAYGLRMKDIRDIAKRIVKNSDWRGFYEIARPDSHEEAMIMGFVVGYAKCGIDERLKYIARYVDIIDSWALCDSFCSTLKPAVKKEQARVFSFLLPYTESDREYDQRFAAVLLMDCFVDDEYIDETLRILSGMNHDGYYVKMAVAWALSVCLIKYRDKTMRVIAAKKLDKFTQNKTIQKARESFRVSDEDKELLKSYRL